MSWRVVALLALTAWGAFAFGAVYPWAFTPLFAGAALAGVVALVQRTGVQPAGRSLAIALTCLLAAVALQLVPVPVALVQRLSPETDVFLRLYGLGYAQSAVHALSIQPQSTMLGLAAAAALAVLLLGLGRALTREDTVQIVRGLCVIGVLLALAGMIQKSLWNGKIYGLWTPENATGHSFGPFVNRNHFAGWMLMTLPLAIGYLCGRIARGARAAGPGWRNRVIWFSSPDASETILVAAAIFVMALALALTMSRSGILWLFVALGITVWFVVRRQATASRRMLVILFMAFVFIAAVGWAGVDLIADRFARDSGNRLPIWQDTLDIAGRFPLAGTGVGTYGLSTLHYQRAFPEVHLAQAHNDYLQLLAEGGALVTIPAIALAFVVASLIRRRLRDSPHESTDYWIRIGAVTGIVAIALQEIGEFSLQMPGNAVLFVVLIAIAIRPSFRGRPDARGCAAHSSYVRWRTGS